MNRHFNLTALLLVLLLFVPASSSRAGFLDELLNDLDASATLGVNLDNETITKGLKEAISTSARRAVDTVSLENGYFDNQMIRIIMPENLQIIAEQVRAFGFREEVDDFVLRMNRAAENAAPKATEHLVAALKTMTFEDARKILQGNKTAATEYFQQKCGKEIHAAFKPVVSSSLQNVGTVQSYQQMMKRFKKIPFARDTTFLDLDQYVTDKAVEGLFKMIGEEERKIRTNPDARGTNLLQKVFEN